MAQNDHVGSIKHDRHGKERHWMDAVRIYKPPSLPRLPKQKASLAGQRSIYELLDDEPEAKAKKAENGGA